MGKSTVSVAMFNCFVVKHGKFCALKSQDHPTGKWLILVGFVSGASNQGVVLPVTKCKTPWNHVFLIGYNFSCDYNSN